MSRNYDQPKRSGQYNRLQRTVLVGTLAVAAAAGLVKGLVGAFQSQNHTGYTISAQQLKNRYQVGGDMITIADPNHPAVEFAEGFSDHGSVVKYYISPDSGKDWTELANPDKGGILVSEQFDNGGDYGNPVDLALTSVNRTKGTVTVAVEQIKAQGVKTIGQASANNAVTHGMAAEVGSVGPQMTGQFEYGLYNVPGSSDGAVGTRSAQYDIKLTSKDGVVDLHVPIPGPDIISGTQV